MTASRSVRRRAERRRTGGARQQAIVDLIDITTGLTRSFVVTSGDTLGVRFEGLAQVDGSPFMQMSFPATIRVRII